MNKIQQKCARIFVQTLFNTVFMRSFAENIG